MGHFIERPAEHLETTLKRMAEASHATVEHTRGLLALSLDELRPHLVDLAGRRDGKGIGAPLDLPATPTLLWPELPTSSTGRPRAYAPERVREALVSADLIQMGLTMLLAGWRDELRPEVWGAAMHSASMGGAGAAGPRRGCCLPGQAPLRERQPAAAPAGCPRGGRPAARGARRGDGGVSEAEFFPGFLTQPISQSCS